MNLSWLTGVANFVSGLSNISALKNYAGIISVVVALMLFAGGSYAIVSYSDNLPDGSKCYFNAICFVPVTTITAIKSIPTATTTQ